MELITFRQWIITRRINSDTPVGDLARDIKDDKNFPNTYDYSEMIGYLKYKGACKEARKAFREAFNIYSKRNIINRKVIKDVN